MTKYFLIICLLLISSESKSIRSPIILTNNEYEEDGGDDYYSNLKYKSDNPDRETSYTTDNLNSFVIPYLLGFNSNNRNLTTQQLASQVFLLSYGIMLKAIDNRLYENNKIFVENYIQPPQPPPPYPPPIADPIDPFKYDDDNYVSYLQSMSAVYPRVDYEVHLNEIFPSDTQNTFIKLNRNNAIDNNDIQILFKNNYD